jgi:hypothetical protein
VFATVLNFLVLKTGIVIHGKCNPEKLQYFEFGC